MVNYQNGKIYKIVGNGNIYYGSTGEPTLARRLAKHRSNYKYFLKGTGSYITSFKCFENDTIDYDISLVELFPCDTKDELHSRERYYIENNICVNKYIPIRTLEETKEIHKQYGEHYRHVNKEHIRAISSQYYIENTELIKAKNEKYRDENKEVILLGRARNRDRNNANMRQYTENNREEIYKRNKQWYEANKETCNAKRKQRYLDAKLKSK